MAKVSIIGLGYMGLPMATVVAEAGHDVVGVDINPEIVANVNAGKAHFKENGLDDKLSNAVGSGKLRATAKPEAADIFIIEVPTPFNAKDKSADMSYVRAAASSIASVVTTGNLIILESTSPIGAGKEHVKDVIEKLRPELQDKVLYAFCPERAIPGETMRELVENDRIIGGLTASATEKSAEFYATFVTGEIIKTNANTAEMVKLVENASRDVQIAFANELSLICDKMNLDVWEVIELANKHPRVNILKPSAGVGGHCIAIDPWFIIKASNDESKLMQTARAINDSKPQWVVDKVKEALKDFTKTPTIALMGLAYKQDVEDLRESPAVKVGQLLQEQTNANIIACEPNIVSHKSFALTSMEDAIEKSDILLFLTAHKEFKELTKKDFEDKIIIDPIGVCV